MVSEVKSRLAQRQNWPDWSAVQRGRDELLSWGGVVGRDADVAWSQMTFLVLWSGFFFLLGFLLFATTWGQWEIIGQMNTGLDATLEHLLCGKVETREVPSLS